jgi:hypothetical protein
MNDARLSFSAFGGVAALHQHNNRNKTDHSIPFTS